MQLGNLPLQESKEVAGAVKANPKSFGKDMPWDKGGAQELPPAPSCGDAAPGPVGSVDGKPRPVKE